MNDTYLKGHHYGNVTVGDQDAQVRQRGVFEVSCEDLSQLCHRPGKIRRWKTPESSSNWSKVRNGQRYDKNIDLCAKTSFCSDQINHHCVPNNSLKIPLRVADLIIENTIVTKSLFIWTYFTFKAVHLLTADWLLKWKAIHITLFDWHMSDAVFIFLNVVFFDIFSFSCSGL